MTSMMILEWKNFGPYEFYKKNTALQGLNTHLSLK